MKGDAYTCAMCKGEFLKGCEEGEAEAEFEDLWGHSVSGDEVIVCDDCFAQMNALWPIRNAVLYTQMVEALD